MRAEYLSETTLQCLKYFVIIFTNQGEIGLRYEKGRLVST